MRETETETYTHREKERERENPSNRGDPAKTIQQTT